MDLRQLRYLVAVADAGTFVRAAERLRVAQPALTRQLHDLERELSVDLFEKGARRATLTKAGEACARVARHVLQDTGQALTRARMYNAGLAGECRLVCGPLIFLSGFVGRLVARMQVGFPGIELLVLEGEAGEGWDRLAEGRADIGISIPPPAEYQSLVVETQWVEVVEHALVHPDHPLAQHTRVTLRELSAYAFLTLDGKGPAIDSLNRHFHEELARQGIAAPPTRRLTSLTSLLAHVRAGQGWMLLPSAVRERFAPLIGVPIADYRVPYPVARMWRRGDDRAVIRTMIAQLREMEHEDRGGRPTPPGGVSRQGSEVEVPPRLELRHLHSYVQVAQAGSFGRAAEALDITQPALSRQMKDLEYDVGVSVFERGARGVELTPAGLAFLEDITRVLSVADRLAREAHRADRGVAQRCVVGVVPHPSVDQLIADIVARLESQTNRVRLGTRMLGTPSILAALDASEIDLGIGFAYPARVPDAPHLAHVPLFDDELSFAYLAPSHPLARSKSLSLADLKDVPFLFPGRATFPHVYDVVMHSFGVAGVQPRIDASYEGAITIWAMAAQGLGWAPGLRRQSTDTPMGLVAIPLKDFSLPWGSELVYRKDESRASVLAAADAIVARARALFGAIAPRPAARTPMPPEQ